MARSNSPQATQSLTWSTIVKWACISRESGYLLIQRRKNATRHTESKRETASIRQLRGCLVDTFTKGYQITIECPIIKGTQFHSDSRGIRDDSTRESEKRNQSEPGGMCIRNRKIVVTHPHRQICHRNLAHGHHLIFTVIQLLHGSFFCFEIF